MVAGASKQKLDFKSQFQIWKLKMAYIYLLDIYELIDQRVADAQAAMENGSGDPNEQKYQEGRIKALTDFQDYLTTHINPKLPRRIRQSLKLR